MDNQKISVAAPARNEVDVRNERGLARDGILKPWI